MTNDLLADLTDGSGSSKRQRKLLAAPVLGIIESWATDIDTSTIGIEPDRFKQDNPIAHGVRWWMLHDEVRDAGRPDRIAQRVYTGQTLVSTSQLRRNPRSGALAVSFKQSLCEALADELSATILRSVETYISEEAYDLLHGVITALLLEFLPVSDCLEMILAEVPAARAICDILEEASRNGPYSQSASLEACCQLRARYKIKQKIKRNGFKRKESIEILVEAESILRQVPADRKREHLIDIAMIVAKLIARLLLAI